MSIFIRGTLDEFKAWHEKAKIKYGIPPEGKIGFIDGVPAPDNQRTYEFVDVITNPKDDKDHIWETDSDIAVGKVPLTKADIDNLEWFKDGAGIDSEPQKAD